MSKNKKKSILLLASSAIVIAGTYITVQMGKAPTAENSTSAEVVGEKNPLEKISASKEEYVKYVEGDHYVKIDPIYGLPENSVVEVLWYGCPHCYNMEKVVSSEDFKKKSDDWSFQQVHIAKKDGPIGFDFKIYSALKQMGLDKTVGKEYMKALHEDGLDRSKFEDFAKKHGLSIEALEKLGGNEESENYFKFISQFSDRDEFKGVPTFVVEGKYIINNKYDVADVANHLLNEDNK